MRAQNTVFVSAVVPWEIAIKVKIQKLRTDAVLIMDFPGFVASQGILPLDIAAEHAQATYRLPLHHRNPFDRMLIAQAMMENLP